MGVSLCNPGAVWNLHQGLELTKMPCLCLLGTRTACTNIQNSCHSCSLFRKRFYQNILFSNIGSPFELLNNSVIWYLSAYGRAFNVTGWWNRSGHLPTVRKSRSFHIREQFYIKWWEPQEMLMSLREFLQFRKIFNFSLTFYN